MNLIDKIIGVFSPKAAFERSRYRAVTAAYEAAKPDRTRTGKIDNSSGDRLSQKAGNGLHGFARHLEQNNDFCYSILLTKTNNVVGAKGITVEPMPLRKDGTIHTEFKKELLAGWENWKENPEVSRSASYAECEKLAYWAKQRDGECFIQFLVGEMTYLNHRNQIPFSIELIERDYLPIWNSNNDRLQQSIERNGWGEAVNYYVLKQHPEGISFQQSMDYRIIPASRMLHLKRVTRFKQSRGIPLFAQIIKSLEWVGSYLRSESIAALTASMFAVVIKKGSFESYEANDATAQRMISLDSGTVIDDLLPGESLEVVSSNRPNSASTPFIDLVSKFMCSSVGVSFSNVTNNYIGSYTSQRAERMDAQKNYESDANEFINEMTKPVYKKHIEMGVLAGVYKLPKDLDVATIYNASYSSPAMSELDPLRDANASQTYIQNGLKSTSQVIREKGGNPDKILEEESEYQTKAEKKGLWFNTFIQKSDNKKAA
jgi:lambda family phage portal protein